MMRQVQLSSAGAMSIHPATILLVAHENGLGGANRVLLTMLQTVKSERFDFMTIVPGPGPMYSELARLGARRIAAGDLHGYSADAIPALFRIIRKSGADWVHINSFCGGSRNAGIAALLAGKQFSWHIHETVPKYSPFLNLFFLRFASALLACSRESAIQFQAHIHPRKKIRVIYNGIEAPESALLAQDRQFARSHIEADYGIPPGVKLVLTLGRVTPDKGQDLLLEVARNVLRRVPDAYFLVLGSQAPEDAAFVRELRQQIAADAMAGQIIMAGYQEDKRPFMLAADLLVHTSRKEAFGLAVGEALAYEMPVVAFAVGGIGEIVQVGVDGVLVEPFDTCKMSEAVIDLLQDDILRRRMGKAGRERMLAAFTVDAFSAGMEEFFSEMLGVKKEAQ